MNSDALALARRLAELDQKETAQQAYTLVLQQSDGSDPAAEMEAASYIFFQRESIRQPIRPLFLCTTADIIKRN